MGHKYDDWEKIQGFQFIVDNNGGQVLFDFPALRKGA